MTAVDKVQPHEHPDGLEAQLDDWMMGDLWEIDITDEPPTLLSIDAADRALRRVSRLEADMAAVEELARERVNQINEWANDRLEPLLRERDWWLVSAEGWMRAHHEATGTKSVQLPSGKLALRKAQPKAEPVWAEPPADVPDSFVRVTRSWDRNAVKNACQPGPEIDLEDMPDGYTLHRAVTADGEVVEGINLLVPTRPSFSHKTGGGEQA